MARKRFRVVYAPQVRHHLKTIPLKYHGLIQQAIKEQLMVSPGRRTRNRKPLEEVPGPFASAWELRCGRQGEFRVFYEFDADDGLVSVLAIGIKDRNRLLFGGEEIVS